MALLTAALNTDFTPAVGDFNVQATGRIQLHRKNSAGAANWAQIGELYNQAAIVYNPVAGAVYRFVQPAPDTGGVVQADQ